MSHFDRLCEVLETMDPERFNLLINEKSSDIIKGMEEMVKDDFDIITIYIDFLLCAAAADGRLAKEEYILLKPTLDFILGKDVGYEDAQKVFYDAGLDRPEEYKKSVDAMVDLLGLLSPELKDDMILVCMMVCAVDGRISQEEKEWIKRLIE